MIGYSVLNTQSVAGASSPEVGVSRPACCQEALCETPPSQTPPPSGGSCHSLACGRVVPGSSSTAMLFLPWPYLTTSPTPSFRWTPRGAFRVPTDNPE